MSSEGKLNKSLGITVILKYLENYKHTSITISDNFSSKRL